MQNTVTIDLSYPVQLADGELTTLTMRRPTVGDILKYPIKGREDFKGEVRLYAVLCNVGVEDMESLDMEDYGKVQDTFISFRTGAVRE